MVEIEPYYINTMEEYELIKERKIEPLIDTRFFIIDIVLRVQLQNKLFGLAEIGKRNIPKANEKFYRWCWQNKIHVCEECYKPLLDYSAIFISHILTKGAKPEMAHDPRNVNILCFEHHNKWENGTENVRSKMRIYAKNIKRIKQLKLDYRKL